MSLHSSGPSGPAAFASGDLSASDRSAAPRAMTAARFRRVRDRSESLADPLSPEDQTAQSMADASPAKWHLAHTSWFFETFLLEPHLPAYRSFDPHYRMLFNSYYEAVGPRPPRPERGLITRPGTAEIADYRLHVTAAMLHLIDGADEESWPRLAPLIALGLAHEEQHQELILTDILHLFSCNPLRPAYCPAARARDGEAPPLDWFLYDGGLREIGHRGGGFAFDNEGPCHQAWLAPFRLASRLVTNGEYRRFIEEDGYRRPEFWLSDGWAAVQQQGWQAPLYWLGDGMQMTLAGPQPLDEAAPVCHVGFYEADAFARWAGKRLPTEQEWECAARLLPPEELGYRANLLDSGALRPLPAPVRPGHPAQMFGDVWEWTQSAYGPYPGFRPAAGAIGEYNGKFMCSQMVLRGGSCATPPGHLRATYRNFFPPAARWQFAGLRLAEDA